MASFSCIDGEGAPVTKVMLLPAVVKLLVTTYASSNKVKFFRQSPKTSIYFVDKRFYRGVSLE